MFVLLAALCLLPHATPVAGAKAAKAMVVGTDAADDWGSNAEAALQPVGQALGQELVEASIGMADKATVNFIIKTAFLPPSGGVPEISRYVWSFTVDGEYRELDGKFTNYSRGACDPTSGQCPPPRDPGLQPFLVRGNCRTENVIICDELGVVQATFDAAASTITIPVPLELMGAKLGSKIGPGSSDGGYSGNVFSVPTAFYSLGNFPHDGLSVLKTFTVPKR
jgi:hypothetical protein